MRACVHGLLLWLALLVPTAQATQVVFINPGRADEPFWRGYAQFMHAAARDLGLELQIVYAERDPQRLISAARQILQGRNGLTICCSSTSITPARRSSVCLPAAGSSCSRSTAG